MDFRLTVCLLLVGLLATVSTVTAQQVDDSVQPEVTSYQNSCQFIDYDDAISQGQPIEQPEDPWLPQST